MAIIIATGSNLNDRLNNLQKAKDELNQLSPVEAQSRIYQSDAIEYLDQPFFYNQILQLKTPGSTPKEFLDALLKIETKMGRVRTISKGPRIIDLDIIFWEDEQIDSPNLTIPHPAWQERSFVALPLNEVPFGKRMIEKYNLILNFKNRAWPIDSI